MKHSKWYVNNWAKWTLAKKIRHVVAVIFSLLASLFMVLITIYIVLLIFSFSGFVDHVRDSILLELIHFLFG